MKRLFALILLLSLLCLWGCGKPAEQTAPTTEATQVTASSDVPQTTEETEAPVPSTTEEVTGETCTPALYKVTGENDAVLYLFGSIHATDYRAYPLPDYVMQAYEESDYLAVECDITDYAAQGEMAAKMLESDGTTIADHIGQETYEAAKTFLTEQGQYYSLLDNVSPAVWMSLLENIIVEMSGLDAMDGIDLFFLCLAAEENKEIREVESLEFQYDLLTGFSDELMSLIIGDLVEYSQEAADDNMALYEVWLAGDEAAFAELSEEEVPEEEAGLYVEYTTKLLTERNISMADTTEDYLVQGGTGFFVVGAAHIIGEGACAELLAQRGYSVERIG